jgi:small subunit ribosomal protein S8e
LLFFTSFFSCSIKFVGVAKKTRIMAVVYNASNNELVRTNTLVKNSVVEIDATPFKEYYEKHYMVAIPKKGETDGALITPGEVKTDNKDAAAAAAKRAEKAATIEARRKDRVVDPKILEQMQSGRLLAVISSRPGQSGRADGYVLEGPELEFYMRKLAIKKGKGAH